MMKTKEERRKFFTSFLLGKKSPLEKYEDQITRLFNRWVRKRLTYLINNESDEYKEMEYVVRKAKLKMQKQEDGETGEVLVKLVKLNGNGKTMTLYDFSSEFDKYILSQNRIILVFT